MNKKSEKPIRKILLTTDTVGGVWTYGIELSRALIPYGIEIFMASMGNPLSQKQRQAVRQCENVQIFESRFKLEWMNDPWKDIRAAGEWLLELEDLIDPDIVHLNQMAFGRLPWQNPALVVGHSCVYSWFEGVGKTPGSDWERYRREVAAGLRAAPVVVAPSRAMLKSLKKFYGPFQQEKVIYNGRFAGDFYPAEKEPLIFAMGRLWDQAKNIGVLEKIAGQLPWPVQVAGDNAHPEGGKIQFDGLKLLGKIDQRTLAQHLARSAIFALPAHYEPFGLSALEAGLSGCALVLGDIPSLREIWQDAALFAAPDDHQSLQHKINFLIENPGQLKRYSARARRQALLYSRQKMAGNYLDLYQALMAAQKSGTGRRKSRTPAKNKKKILEKRIPV
ncbi:MAG: glycosyltransferase family 4 protein [Calditrichia bacterium]